MKPRISTGWIVALIVLFAALAVGSFIVTAVVEGAWQSIVSGLGSTFLSIALALLVTEVWLRPLFTTDVITAAGLSRRVADIGFRDLKSEAFVDFASFYRQGADIWVSALHPAEWIARDLELLLDAAASRKATYQVAFPQPGASARGVAQSLGLDSDAFDASVRSAAHTLETEWRARSIDSSILVIHWLDSVPRSVLASNGSTVLVGVESSIYKATQRTFVLEIELGKSSDVETWVRKSLSSSQSSVADPPVWTSRKSGA